MADSDQSSHSSSASSKKRKPAMPRILPVHQLSLNSNKIVINLSMTHYEVIQDVADELGWKIQRKNNNGNWDILWTDHHIETDILIKMHLFQKISHFPGIHVLARKNLLGMSLMEMAKRFPNDYNFFPKTFLLPNQYSELRHDFEKGMEKNTYIVKPEADCQGRGIFLTQKLEDVENGKHYVIQEYLTNPYLIDGLKFDFRVYVLLCGINPMRLYIYEEGLARFATEPYTEPTKDNLKKQYIHLTNYAINKKNPKFIYNTSVKNMNVGHKRSLTSIFKLMQKKGQDVPLLKKKIDDIIVKTFILGLPLVSHQYRFCQPDDENRNMCFHILGIDVMIDGNCNPYVLEVNHTPSFVTDTPLDYHIKYDLIKDTLKLMNINSKTKAATLERMSQIARDKLINGKRQLYENAEKQERVKQAQQLRDSHENRHLGKFRRAYPCQNQEIMLQYNKFIEVADKAYFSEFNVLRAQIQKQKLHAETKGDRYDKNSGQMSSSLPMSDSPKKAYSFVQRESNKLSITSKKSELRQKIHPIIQTRFERTTSVKLDDHKKPAQSQNKFYDIESQLLNQKLLSQFQSHTSMMRSKLQMKSKNIPRMLPRLDTFNKNTSPINSIAPFEVKQTNQYINYRKKKIQALKMKEQAQHEDISPKINRKREQSYRGIYVSPRTIQFLQPPIKLESEEEIMIRGTV